MGNVSKFVVVEKRYSPEGHPITKCCDVCWNGVLYGTSAFANEIAWRKALRSARELSESSCIEHTVEEREDCFAVVCVADNAMFSPAVEFWMYPVKPMPNGIGYEYRRCHIVKTQNGFSVYHIRRDIACVKNLDEAIRFCNSRLYELHGD